MRRTGERQMSPQLAALRRKQWRKGGGAGVACSDSGVLGGQQGTGPRGSGQWSPRRELREADWGGAKTGPDGVGVRGEKLLRVIFPASLPSSTS